MTSRRYHREQIDRINACIREIEVIPGHNDYSDGYNDGRIEVLKQERMFHAAALDTATDVPISDVEAAFDPLIKRITEWRDFYYGYPPGSSGRQRFLAYDLVLSELIATKAEIPRPKPASPEPAALQTIRDDLASATRTMETIQQTIAALRAQLDEIA